MTGMYSVGEMAVCCGVSTRTLRYYDELDLVKPEYVDPDTGYRYYKDAQVDRLRLILVLKEVGMSLDEIQAQCKNMDSRKYLSLLGFRKENLRREIDVLKKRLLSTERHESDLLLALSSMKTDSCFLRILSQIDGYFVPAQSQDRSLMRPLLRKLERLSSSGAMPGNVIRVVAESNLRAGSYTDYSGFIVRSDSSAQLECEPIVYPERLYAVSYCPVSRPESGPYWERLLSFVYENGYEIAGDGLKKILLEKGITLNDSEYISMLSVPVKPALGATE